MADPELFTLLAAVLSDDAKAKRLVELQEREVKAREAEAAAELKLGEVKAQQIDAQRLKAEAEAMHQNIVGKQAELEEYERTLSDHNQALLAEKAAWEKIRQDVDAEQKKTDASLAKWHEELVQREAAVHDREVMIGDREKAAAGLAAESKMRISRLRDALHAVEPQVVPEATEDVPAAVN